MQRPYSRLTILVVVALGLAGFAWRTGSLGVRMVAAAKDAIATRNLDLAEEKTRDALRWAPTASNRFLLARVLRKKGDIEAFAEALKAAEHAGVDPFDVELEAALSYAQSGRINQVESLLFAAIESRSEAAEEAFEAYVNGCLFSARLDEASSAISEWITVFPQSANAHFYDGRLRSFYGQSQQAKTSFEKALAIRPNHFPAAYLLGAIAEGSNDHEEALRLFRVSSGLRHNAAARLGEARVLRSIGSVEAARQVLESLLTLSSDTLSTGFKRYGERYEGDPVRRELGSLEVAAGNYTKAHELLDRAIEANPRDLAAMQARGLAHRGMGNNDLAAKDLETVREIRKSLRDVDRLVDLIGKNPEVVDERVEVGRIYVEYGSKLTGEYWLKSALSRDPDCLEAHRLLAELYASWSKQDALFRDREAYHRARISELDG